MTVHNITTYYQLQLIDSYDNGLQLDQTRNVIILKKPINTFPLINNQTQLPIKVALVNQINGTVLITTFPLNITYPTLIDSCLGQDCGNGTCTHFNQRLHFFLYSILLIDFLLLSSLVHRIVCVYVVIQA